VAATSFQTETSTFRKLLGNGLTYRIPPFQRDYSWTEEEWEDLWTDLMSTVEAQEEPAHYMGYVVLQARTEKSFDVIDGQQRLTTLTLLVLAVLKHLQRLIDAGEQADANQQRLEALRRTYIGSLDPVSLTAKSKLALNRNNDAFFQQYLVPLQRPKQRGLTLSERALKAAFEWFDKRVGEYLQRHPGDHGVELAQLVEAMSDKLFFTVINVTDELNAYRVFETLNARGVKLSSTDLLKNYLFSVLSRDKSSKSDDLPELERRWESLVGGLGSDDFPEFLRAHWLSQGRFVRHADLFKAVSKAVINREQVFKLLRDLDGDLDRYVALRSPASSSLSPKAKELASQLKLFHVRQPYPLLIAAMRAFSAGEFEDVLRACVTVCFRYNVICGLSPGEQEPVFAEASRAIADGTSRGAADTIRALARVYPSDEQFKSAFVEKLFTRGKEKLARFVLCELERQLTQVPIDRDADTLSLEHVLPQAPEAGWDAFDDQEVETMTFLISNLVLLRKGPNSNLGNKPYAEKRPILLASEFEATRRLAEENADWTPERLLGRQHQLASVASAIWKISQLS
jgi:hypothetical protein